MLDNHDPRVRRYVIDYLCHQCGQTHRVAEILSNVVDRHAIGGEYPRSEHEQFLRLRLGL
jgi:hypothetical protein